MNTMTVTACDNIDKFIASQTKSIYDRAMAKGIKVNTLNFTGDDMRGSVDKVLAENKRLLRKLGS